MGRLVHQVRVEDEVGAALLVTGVVGELALLLLLLVEPVPDLVLHPLVQVRTLDTIIGGNSFNIGGRF